MTTGPDGVLVVDKPRGPTSHDVVARVRRAIGCRRVGHTGTLDPMASGVLALVTGRATRLAQFLSSSDKAYEAAIRLGVETDSYDALGQVVTQAGGSRESPAPMPGPAEVEAALARFRGDSDQAPPPFSAKRVAGVRAYTLARREQQVALRAVRVRVSELELVDVAADVMTLRLTCSAGFYVRSLAHDLGRALGCGAHLAALRRTRSGEFGLDAAVTLDVLELDPAEAANALVPMERVLAGWPAARLTSRGVERARHGAAVGPEDVAGWEDGLPAAAHHGGQGPRVRLIGPEGRLIAIAARSEPAGWPLRPGVVLD